MQSNCNHVGWKTHNRHLYWRWAAFFVDCWSDFVVQHVPAKLSDKLPRDLCSRHPFSDNPLDTQASWNDPYKLISLFTLEGTLVLNIHFQPNSWKKEWLHSTKDITDLTPNNLDSFIDISVYDLETRPYGKQVAQWLSVVHCIGTDPCYFGRDVIQLECNQIDDLTYLSRGCGLTDFFVRVADKVIQAEW